MPLIDVVCTVLAKNHRDQCLLCLDLVNVLLEIRGKDVITVPELRNVLIETLKKENDDVEIRVHPTITSVIKVHVVEG